ncbi:MAG TPA: nuclear transport factor 2 family protein [Candidatus Acidoferrum sp.]|nr:nuclear transport factor 2 family protein [Candidatus Acidoferrum sp.]
MTKIASSAALILALALAPAQQSQQSQLAWREACVQRCYTARGGGDPELERQEIVSLEKEAARAIQQNNGTFFRRVYVDDYAGTLSHGQVVNKTQWINVIQAPATKYQSFIATDVSVRFFEETAVATCLWSARAIVNGQLVSGQVRTMHVYVNTTQGWHVVSGQATILPPDTHLAL